MAKKKNIYDENSIITLNPREFTRLRPATYLGSNEHSTQLVREVFSNSLDEHIIGHGDLISVIIDTKANTYSVIDNGQGFPINVVKEDETVLQAAFDKFNTSGKYSDDGVYMGVSQGLNGIGSKLTNFLSKSLYVKSVHDGKFEALTFKDGVFQSRELGDTSEQNGTAVTWTPDEQFFQDASANLNDLKKLFTDISALCSSLTIKLVVDGKETIFNSPNGLQSLLDNKVASKELLTSRFIAKKTVDQLMLDMALTYTTDYSETIIPYVNYGLTESGIHISTMKSLITKQINKAAMDLGYIKNEEDEFSSAEISEGLFIAFNVRSTNVKYDSQTKVRVVDLDRSLIRNIINNDFPVWLEQNQKDAKTIIERALNARKARTAAQKAKDGIRNAKSTGKKFISLPTKLVDAYSKKRSECELFVTEGDSAKNGLVGVRNTEKQALFPIRGKILNCTKATPDKVYANQEICNIVKAIGLDIDKETGKLIYDEKKLRYGKIFMATDGDDDGYHIRLLLINMFWWLCPELIINGHIWAAEPPLYKVTTSKNEYVFLRDTDALESYKKSHKKESITINRLKGLGECDPDELAQCILKPETRHVEQIICDDYNSADNMLELFMGQEVGPRREYLLQNDPLQI